MALEGAILVTLRDVYVLYLQVGTAILIWLKEEIQQLVRLYLGVLSNTSNLSATTRGSSHNLGTVAVQVARIDLVAFHISTQACDFE